MSGESLVITSGLPYAKEIVITLPVGRTWWTQLSDFEVLMQLREEKRRDSTLVKDLTQYLTVTMDDANTVSVQFSMTGADTRALDRGGFYDVLISDVGTTDARAYILLFGTVKRMITITAETVGAP